MIPYPAMLDVSGDLVRFVCRPLRRERALRRTPKGSRAPTCWKHAVFAISWFRSRPNIALHGKAFGISQATAYRYPHEAVNVLAARAPDLREALGRAATDGVPHLILDGKVFDTDRCRIKTTSVKGEEIDEWSSGRTGAFGGNVQALCEPDGFPIWTSEVEPGGTVDLEAARRHVLPAAYPYTKTMPILADPGYQGAVRGVVIPFKQPSCGNALSIDNRTRNALQRALCCLGERGFALLTERWTTLQHITLSPSRLGDLVRADLVLVHFEHHRIK
ncbi:DDE superfamily endonuclease [Sinosporangium album]|uniref:DDE superfamily endonuclease n=1 Tax=Sinosporangium album TaxID=504805 RepID=A0A1G8F1B2_9ACTN|nr:transposase [Sinosporangium album]SDH75867.1 DDE superfamily endonuclease [Sinosporangium album]